VAVSTAALLPKKLQVLSAFQVFSFSAFQLRRALFPSARSLSR
jgi:hypothetical protein